MMAGDQLRDPLIVKTRMGLIRGLKSEDKTYNMFLGVPYGKVHADDPFGFSFEYPNFDYIFDANDDSNICPQLEEFNKTIVGNLDCLRLNIYVPNLINKTFPVIVWIHGGEFEFGFGGSSFYGPKYFMKHEVILIMVNYRLGPYGLISLDTPQVPGNQGFRDAILALKWIKINVEYFGGDVNNITLCGHSSGATIVQALLTLDDNLFNKVILMSPPFEPLFVKTPNKTDHVILARHLGFETDDSVLAFEYLNKVDPKLLIKAQIEAGIHFFPCFEQRFENVEQIVTNNIKTLLLPKSKHIPILIGNASDESMMPVHYKIQDLLESWNIFGETLNVIFNFRLTEHQTFVENIVSQFYIGDEKLKNKYDEKILRQITNFRSDFNFVFPTLQKVENFLGQGLNKVYYYIFSFEGNRNFAKNKFKLQHVDGSTHADDIGYMFDIPFESVPTTKDQLTIDRMTTLWINFAKYGDPTFELSELIPVKWLPVSKDTMHYLDIGDELIAGSRPIHDRMAFWNLLFKTQQEYIKSFGNTR